MFNFLIKKRSYQHTLSKWAKDENYIFIRRHRLFSQFSDGALVLVISRLIERRYSRNEIIFKKDAPAICMFIVKKGRVECNISTKNDDTLSLISFEPNEIFGELGLISKTYRSVNAKSTEHGTLLLSLSHFDLDALNEQFSQDAFRLLTGITDSIIHQLMAYEYQLSTAYEKLNQIK